ncbi:MAG: helix-turn-helix domain-containing protein [Candidatus Thorarchaeota archaeon]|nr:helix-turn-helix domain-containing protein [Candidatus Thorarchaeota archaeon]
MKPTTQSESHDLDKVFKALGHVTRRRILQLLAQTPRYAYELSKLLNLNRRVVLKHLESLQEAGLIDTQVGGSDVGPERTYYRLSVSFGLSTTILPNAFVVGLTSASAKAPVLYIPSPLPEEHRSELREVRVLLTDLHQIGLRIQDLEDERMRLAAVRGQLMQRLEGLMAECSLDSESCRRIREIVDPEKRSAVPEDGSRARSSDDIRDVLSIFQEGSASRSEKATKSRQESRY